MDFLIGFISELLDTIEYPGDKKDFSKKMLAGIYARVLDELEPQLTNEQKAQFTNDNINTDIEKVNEFLKNKLSEDKLLYAYEKATSDILTDYIKTIEPSLNEQQKASLITLFEKLESKYNTSDKGHYGEPSSYSNKF